MKDSLDTTKLTIAVNTEQIEKSVFPRSLIDALRKALEAGLTTEEITASILLMIGVKEIGRIDEMSIVGRTKETLTVMKGLQQIEKMESKWRGRKEPEEFEGENDG